MSLLTTIKETLGIGPLSRHSKSWLSEQPRSKKRALVVLMDLASLLPVMAGCIYMRTQVGADFIIPSPYTLLMLFALPFLSVASFYYLGLYRLVTRRIGRKGMWRIGYSLLVAIMVWSLVIFLVDSRGTLSVLPRSVLVGYWGLGWLMIAINRQVTRWWMRDLPLNLTNLDAKSKKKVVIYGAGEAGLMLLKTLNESGQYSVIGFFDDDTSLWSMKMDGHKIHSIDQLDKLIAIDGVREVFIAIPSLNRTHKRSIIRKLEPYPVNVRILPELADIATGRIEISDLRNIEINDLLGRDPVQPIPELMQRNNTGKIVMVTGAGGSIGSEISRQIFDLNPRKLILLELSELALYSIKEELMELRALQRKLLVEGDAPGTETDIISVLGSVGDDKLVRELVREHGIETVYHTAAYKHIPLLEENPASAIENNVFATVTLARVMQEEGVGNMVLISSDKAVRPSNIKGASNRLQEMVLQALAEDKDGKTIFSIVRFGNVLDSSGSVVPRFREQIKRGGPVTVTHHEIIRYFMSIREAAQLVIQAGAMALGGEVYVLDMGEPVKIDNLARTMIRLSGREVMDEDNPDGDIEVKYIGLRPGDKMYEELLIKGNIIGSRHPYIMRLGEPSSLGMKELTLALDTLEHAMRSSDLEKIQNVLTDVVEGYRDESVLRSKYASESQLEKKSDARPPILH